MSHNSHERRFVPGDWYAVCGDTVTVILPPSARSRVAGIWELSDAGAADEVILDAVLRDGLSGLSDLLMVVESAGRTRLLVRGSVSVTVRLPEETVVVTAEPDMVWVERWFVEPIALTVQLGASDPAAGALLGAVTRVGGIEFALAGTSDREPELEQPEHPVSEKPAPEQLPDSTVEPAPEQLPDSTVEPAPEQLPDSTVEPAPELVAVEPVAADVVVEHWADRDGQTQAGIRGVQFDRPPILGQEVAPSVVARSVAKLAFSSGEMVDVDRVIIAGRAPEAKRFASHEQPLLITVASPHQEVSATHLEIRPGAGADHGVAIVTDLGSTNGTVLVQPGLPVESLQPGIAVSLLPGAVLDLGDGVTIQVMDP